MKFISTNIERILWITAIVVIILAFKKCGGGKQDEKIKALQAQSKLLQDQHKTDSLTHAREYARWQDSIAKAAINSDLQVKVIKETEKKLQVSQSSINRLTAIIRNAQPPDSINGVLVSRQYKDACDSIPNKIDSQNVVIAQLKDDNESLVDLMNYEVVLRDSALEAGNEHITRLNNSFAVQQRLLNEAIKLGKPRGQFLIGIGIIGNQEQFLGGASGKAAYLTKGGKMYQYSPHVLKLMGMESAKLYHELSVFFNPFK